MPRFLVIFAFLGLATAADEACADGSCSDDDVTLLQLTRQNVVKEAPLVFDVHCPPPFFHTLVSNFSLEEFISEKWHVQQTTQEGLMLPGPLQCRSAEISALNVSTGWELRELHRLSMRNGTDHLGIELFSSEEAERCLKVTDASQGHFAIGNCSDAPEEGTPFWVVAYGEEQGYAMISGGAPTEVFDGGCRPSAGNIAGLAILTRQQSRNSALVAACSAQLTTMGYDVSPLRDVLQSGCPGGGPAITAQFGDAHVPSHGFGFEGHWHDDHGGTVTIARTGSKLIMEDTEASDGTYEAHLTNETHCELTLHGAQMYGELQASGHHIHWHMSAGHEEWQRVGYEDEDDSFMHGPPVNQSDFSSESS